MEHVTCEFVVAVFELRKKTGAPFEVARRAVWETPPDEDPKVWAERAAERLEGESSRAG